MVQVLQTPRGSGRHPFVTVADVVHCLKCPRSVEYADLSELHGTLVIVEVECVLAGNGPCWLAWAERGGFLRDTVDPRGQKGK